MKHLKRIGVFLLKSLRTNLSLKIIALIFAFVLWSFVMASTNPPRALTLKDVQIVYSGVNELTDKGLTAELEKLVETADITLTARQNSHSNLSRRNAVTATVNLGAIKSTGKFTLEIEVSTGQYDVTVDSISPRTVEVEVDRLMSREIPVRCELQGDVLEGYYIGAPRIASDTVTISGPESSVEKIAEAVCYVPITGVDSSVRASYMLTLLDAQGQQVTVNSITGSVPAAIVELDVMRKKTVTIDTEAAKASVTNVKSGFEVVDVVLTPDTVEIAGSEEVLAGVESVKLAPMNAENAESGLFLTGTFQPIEGVTFLAEHVRPYVQIAEKKEQQTFKGVPVEVEGLAEGLQASLSKRRVDVTVAGNASAVKAVRTGEVRAYVDVAGLTAGTYVLPVRYGELAGVPSSGVRGSLESVTVVIE